ncbi:MAG: carboxypeptidase regulatory-like domain-containing protein [Bacteroidetes bacterium]|nr:carboxypeptidase regulatory-like domain-containing protein [Bacteroidota bacterium]
MKTAWLILLSILLSFELYGQKIVLTGFVGDEHNFPVSYARIHNALNLQEHTATDSSGHFRLEIASDTIPVPVQIYSPDYETKVISVSTSGDITVYLDHNRPGNGVNQRNDISQRYLGYSQHKLTPVFQISYDFLKVDFSGYSGLLDSTNIARLGKDDQIEYQIGGLLSNYSFGIGFGRNVSNYHNPGDSIFRKYYSSQIGLHLGAHFPIGSHFVAGLDAGFKNYRYRMVNKFQLEDQTLTSYLKHPELDIRFNQPVVNSCIEFIYRTDLPVDETFMDFTIGGYFGIESYLSKQTYIYSRNDRLFSDSNVRLPKFIYGIRIGLLIKNDIYGGQN